MSKTNSMTVGKSYEQRWVVLGCPRSHTFTVEAISKNGAARGSLVDADGRKYTRFFVKPERAAEWSECA